MRQILAALTRVLPSRARRVVLIGVLSALPVAPVVAEESDPLVVVELFTSQGCSSCPPADEMMTELASREGVLPLSLHVDYWDYIGWRDAFAQPQFTQRQKAYAHAIGKRTIYTPQMVVQGVEHLVGAKPMRLADLILRHRENAQAPVSLSLTREGTRMLIEAIPTGLLPSSMRIQIVRYIPHERVEIERGENAGRVVDYSNIVTEFRPLADWNGKAPLAVAVELTGKDSTAVILQTATPQGPGPILAAARLE